MSDDLLSKEGLPRSVNFAEMLNTRFCHDMAGPISAVNNGLEFMLDDSSPEMKRQATDLLIQSAKEALSKLQTYRMAYGRVNQGVDSSVKELKEIIVQFFINDKIKLDWPDNNFNNGFGESINNEIRRTLVNMITVVASLLIYGGKLSVIKEGSPLENYNNRLIVKGTNERVKKDPEIQHILNAKQGEAVDCKLSPHNIPAVFLASVARIRDIKLDLEVTDGSEGGVIEFKADYN